MKLLASDLDMSKPGAEIRPAGLGARDTLRTEAGMPLYGHELGEEINALMCGVDFAISLDKADDGKGEPFVGMEALRKTMASGGVRRKLAGFILEGKRSARQGMKIVQSGKEVGVVTSGCPSPTLGKCIAMGFLDTELSAVGTSVQIDMGRGEPLGAAVAALPFYKPSKV
jgi:aminomethyltransferase